MSKYDKFFARVDRKSGYRKPVKVVRSALVPEFLRAIQADPDLSDDERLLVGLLAGSGARISEVLAVKRQVCEPAHFTLRVLKKDQAQLKLAAAQKAAGKPVKAWHPVTRLCKVPDAILAAYLARLARRKPQEFLLRMNRFQALRILKRLFGADMECHSFRHGYVSFLIHSKRTDGEIADLVKIDHKTVKSYAHVTDMVQALASLGL
jgi:integrase